MRGIMLRWCRTVAVVTMVSAGVLSVASAASAATGKLELDNQFKKSMSCTLTHNNSKLVVVGASAKRKASKTFTLPASGSARLSLMCTDGRKRVRWSRRFRVSQLTGKKKARVFCGGSTVFSCSPGVQSDSGRSGSTSGSSSSSSANNTSGSTSGTSGSASRRSSIRFTNRWAKTLTCKLTHAGGLVAQVVAAKNKTVNRAFTLPTNAIFNFSCRGGGKSLSWSRKFRTADLLNDYIFVDCKPGSRLSCRVVPGKRAGTPPSTSSGGSSTPATPANTDGADKTLTFHMKNDFKDRVTCTLKHGSATLASVTVSGRNRTGSSSRFAVPNTDQITLQCKGAGKTSRAQNISAKGLRRGDATKVSGSCYSGGSLMCNANAR